LEYLSNIELYYSADKDSNNNLVVTGEEVSHITRVMRHSIGDLIYVTNGKGEIFKCRINNIGKEYVISKVVDSYKYPDNYADYIFCIPKLKNPERFEFALEKCTELGITRFIVYNALRSITKGDKKERWNKIVTAAMKQSLLSYKPHMEYINRLADLSNFEGKKIIFDQNSDQVFKKDRLTPGQVYYFIFGPEGGLDEKEIKSITNPETYKISPNRLRTETAVIKTASIISG
jgi:16S rRNA (uracil1498-N3)-methyltransferase